MNFLGIDIGTTSISAVLANENGVVLSAVTKPNQAFLKGSAPFEKIQDPKAIIKTVEEAVKEAALNREITAVGVTGQMHGILYTDKNNVPVSPLYIWQDERGNEPYSDELSYAEFLSNTTPYRAAAGFGLTTHFYNIKNGLVPENAEHITTIHDYLVHLLTGEKPVTHASDAASLGFFDLNMLGFDKAELEKNGIDSSMLPEVKKNTVLAGKTHNSFLPDGIPVAVAIGDNQASFLGSVSDTDFSVLVNVGTGSQVSFVTSSLTPPKTGEIRPLTDGKYLYVGSSLCGGRAYAALKQFFASCAELTGGSDNGLYKKMDVLAQSADCDGLKIDCAFCGTRENPKLRGAMSGLGLTNFTPAAFCKGVLTGVAEELYLMYSDAAKIYRPAAKYLYGSGNGLRNSAVWRDIFSERFGLKLLLPTATEEAAIGAAVFAAAASGFFGDIASAAKAMLTED